MKGRLFLFIGLLCVMLSDVNAATTIDGGAFDNIFDAFRSWIGGSLGLTIALLGPLSFILALMFELTFKTVALSPKFYFGVLMFPMFVGGVIGMVETMAGLGRSTFG